ncbi:MAG: ABC transporter substrate-binding protein, partial [Candidatus Paceibacterota bacterium]
EIAKTLDQTMTELNGSKVVDETYAQMGAGDFRTDILKLKQAKVDAVFLDMLDIDALSFIKQAKELNYQPKIITHTLILDALKNAKIDRKLLEGIVVVNWEIDSPQFAQLFKAKYNIDSAKSDEQSYQAVYVLAQAIANAKDKGTVSQYLEGQSFNVLGKELKFTPDHTISSVPVEIQTIKNGQLIKLY